MSGLHVDRSGLGLSGPGMCGKSDLSNVNKALEDQKLKCVNKLHSTATGPASAALSPPAGRMPQSSDTPDVDPQP